MFALPIVLPTERVRRAPGHRGHRRPPLEPRRAATSHLRRPVERLRGGVSEQPRRSQDLTVEFSSGGYVVRPLDGLSFDADDGELVVLLGPSGCGKTTLLSCLAGLLTPTSGSIKLDGRETSRLTGRDLTAHRRDTVGVVFQAFNLIPSLSAHGNVVAPMRLAGMSRQTSSERADELLDRVGLGERGHHRPGQLSGGQQQRVAIARALVHDPPVVLADEPTAHLDHIQVEGVLQLLRELASPGRVVIVSTHDDRVTHLADRVVELVPNLAGADRPPEELQLEAGRGRVRAGQPRRPRVRGRRRRGRDLPRARRRHRGAAGHRDAPGRTSASWARR